MKSKLMTEERKMVDNVKRLGIINNASCRIGGVRFHYVEAPVQIHPLVTV